MLTDDELTKLVTGRETDRVERKESLAADRIREAICGFANDVADSRLPGVVAVGVDDSGVPTGLTVDDDLLLALAQMRDDGAVVPFPSMEVRALAMGDTDVAVVVVEPSDSPPVTFRGRTWIRVGPRRAIATPEDECRLVERRRLSNLPFDARPVFSAGIDSLSLPQFTLEILPQLVAAEILERNERPIVQQLAALHFTDPDGRPTPTGLLTIGLSPQDHIPGAYVQFNRFHGNDLGSEVVISRMLSGALPKVMRDLDDLVKVNIETRVDFVGQETERRQPNIPFDAVQQIVRNALIHRTYEASNAPTRILWFADRVEIQSPGGPYGQVSIDNFGDPGVADYRNPSLAGVLGQLGYVQRFGAGIAIARRALAENGNPPLELQPKAENVLVVVRY